MITLYHNPRCSKSRQALQLLEEKGETVKIILYLKDIPSEKEVSDLLNLLNISPMELVRTNESIWKEQYKTKKLSNEAIITALVTHPKLIERPIAVKGKNAVIGRPPENVLSLL